MIHFPAVYVKHLKFVEAVEMVEVFGFNPLKTTFVMGIQVILTMRKAVWNSRLEVYARWGWNREMFLKAFRMYPTFVKLSNEMFVRKNEFSIEGYGFAIRRYC